MRSDVLNAIRDEMSVSTSARSFEVDAIESKGNSWIVYLDLSRSQDRLDESLEGAMAWWPAEPRNGAAEVLCVVPEEQQVTLRFATRQPPSKGGTIKIYPPRFLEALMEVWSQFENAEKAEEWFQTVEDDDEIWAECIPPMEHFEEYLRPNQKKAFSLLGRRCGYLWGPPGTGKTFTIAAMLAQALLHYERPKILVMSTTNAATDQILVAVDHALEDVGFAKGTHISARERCKRIGQRFIASHYVGREHLLPVTDDSLVRQLAELQANIPQKTDTEKFAKWRADEELLREQIKRQSMGALDSASLAAMTTTRAAFGFDELKRRGPFDLLVIDEASQFSLSHAMMLATLAECTIFAGDPRQLAPIVQSKNDNTSTWLGTSIFDQISTRSPGMCMLTEQSRMAPAICQLVSTCFYDGKLVVASREAVDPAWHAQRKLAVLPHLPTTAVTIQHIPHESKYSQRYGGHIRYESSELICRLVHGLLHAEPHKEILVLTPFRSQRVLLRQGMQRNGNPRVAVRTVHSSQGMEFDTIIFDPVAGSSNFLRGDDAERLVNVALSRAKARLIICLSDGDRQNPLFSRIAETAKFLARPRTHQM